MFFLPMSAVGNLRRQPKVTHIIIAANLIIYLIRFRMDLHDYWYFFLSLADSLGTFWSQPLRIFLHEDFYHVFFNMLFFCAFAPALEDKMGWKRFLLFYMAAGVFSGVVGDVFQRPGIGASGAISGVMGAYLVRLYYKKINFFPVFVCPPGIPIYFPSLKIPFTAIPFLALYFYYNLTAGVASLDGEFCNIAFWAHISGFFFGVAWSILAMGFKSVRIEKHVEEMIDLAEFGPIMTTIAEPAAKILETDPEHIDAMCYRAKALTRFGPSAEGIRLYRRAIETCARKGDISRAAEIYIVYLNRFEGVMAAKTQRLLAIELIRQGEIQFATRGLELWLEKFPNDFWTPTISLDLVSIYAKHYIDPRKHYQGPVETARNMLDDVIAKNPGTDYEYRAKNLLMKLPAPEPRFQESA